MPLDLRKDGRDMAKTVSVSAGKPEKKPKREAEGERKNTITPTEAREFVAGIFDLRQRKANYVASINSQINNKYESAANKFGLSLTALKHEIRHIVAQERLAEDERNMASSVREDLALFRDMLGDTPLGAFAVKKAEAEQGELGEAAREKEDA